jgi:hypothetical protein
MAAGEKVIPGPLLSVEAAGRNQRTGPSGYIEFAVVLTNTVLLFVGLNLILWPLITARDYLRAKSAPPPIAVVRQYGPLIKKVYAEDHPGLSDREVDQFISETWTRPLQYDRYLEWRERPFRGRFVNVDENGFRSVANQGPWPPDASKFNVFVFGGSTTFGYGVADNETIPSRLQELLGAALKEDVRVYNFGQAAYQSVQERILFERLLAAGFAPHAAVFIDGLNDFYDLGETPGFTWYLSPAFDGKLPARSSLLAGLPVFRAAAYFSQRFGLTQPGRDSLHEDEDAWKGAQDPAIAGPAIERVIHRYQASTKMIQSVAAAYHVSPAFVWQPIPSYHYEVAYHPFYKPSTGWNHYLLSSLGYPEMARLTSQENAGKNFLWCADIQAGYRERLYVDMAHYSPKMNGMVAQCIASRMVERGLTEFRAH